MKLLMIVGARPNFVKLAALGTAARKRPGMQVVTVHTGQHYDRNVSGSFFDDLEMPAPDHNLGVSEGSPLRQIARTLERLEPVLRESAPDVVVVVGDVNSTLAGALAANRLGIPLAHVEAGLRSFDPSMPEEVNRRLTDALSDHLLATEASAVENLAREGIDPERVHLVGNVMIDTLLRFRERAAGSPILDELELSAGGYGVLTLHRPSNVDRDDHLGRLLEAMRRLGRDLPIIFPVHPRTRARLGAGATDGRLRPVAPLGYLAFLRLVSQARLVLTDSGGIQEETTVLGVPCLTIRERTERPVTVSHGTNRVVGTDPEQVLRACAEALNSPPPGPCHPPLWDGHAADRILDILLSASE